MINENKMQGLQLAFLVRKCLGFGGREEGHTRALTGLQECSKDQQSLLTIKNS